MFENKEDVLLGDSGEVNLLLAFDYVHGNTVRRVNETLFWPLRPLARSPELLALLVFFLGRV